MYLEDKLDIKLTGLLEKDSRRSSEELGRLLHVSAATVRRRISRLIERKVLRFSAVVDPNAIGLQFAAVIGFTVVHTKLRESLQWLAKREGVRWISLTTGRFDIVAIVRFHNHNEFSEFVEKEIAELDALKSTETFVCLDVQKSRFLAE